ncbi:MAG: type II toxin-antitoxin system RelE/ParE family toxin [Actinomycetota bacterium]
MIFIQWTNTAFNELEVLPAELSFQIIRQVDFLAQFPEMGALLESRFPRFKEFRQLIIKRNIRVVYEVDKETIFILAVQNCRQKLLPMRDLKRRKRQVD